MGGGVFLRDVQHLPGLLQEGDEDGLVLGTASGNGMPTWIVAGYNTQYKLLLQYFVSSTEVALILNVHALCVFTLWSITSHMTGLLVYVSIAVIYQHCIMSV